MVGGYDINLQLLMNQTKTENNRNHLRTLNLLWCSVGPSLFKLITTVGCYLETGLSCIVY